MDRPPPLPDHALLFWDAFGEACHSAIPDMGGGFAIPTGALVAYLDLHYVRDPETRAEVARMVRLLEGEYRRMVAKGQKRAAQLQGRLAKKAPGERRPAQRPAGKRAFPGAGLNRRGR